MTTVPLPELRDPMLRYFAYAHLPEGPLRATSAMFSRLAAQVDAELPRSPERTVALRKLLEAKDAAVRCALDIVDPGAPDAPVDLESVDLEPGFVIVRCPVCDASQVGRPGDALEHAEDGAHVYHPAGFGA